jgi:hypothetical protein
MPRSHQAVSRQKADRLIKQFDETRKELYKISAKLRALRPFNREAYFRLTVRSPEDAIEWARVLLNIANAPLDEFESAAYGFPAFTAIHADVLPLIQEYVASRGWTEKVRELLAAANAQTETDAKVAASEANAAPVAYA